MKLETAEAVADYLSAKCYTASVEEEYSGRAMFGKTVPAIVTNAPAAIVGFAVAEVTNNDFREVPKRQDNMGLDMVYY